MLTDEVAEAHVRVSLSPSVGLLLLDDKVGFPSFAGFFVVVVVVVIAFVVVVGAVDNIKIKGLLTNIKTSLLLQND